MTAALVSRACSAGARIECGQHVDAIEVRGGRAVAVHTTSGTTVRVRRAVIADTSAPRLYSDLLPADATSEAVVRSMSRFVWDTPVLKINYALNSPIPWRSKSLSDAGTVHIGADRDGLIRWVADLNTSTVPLHPFMLIGQMTTADRADHHLAPKALGPIRTCRAGWPTTHLPMNSPLRSIWY